MSCTSQSKTTLEEVFEDTVEDLLIKRSKCVRKIEEVLSQTTEAKISKMRRMKFKDWETTTRPMTIVFKNIPSFNGYGNATSVADETVKEQDNGLKEEIEELGKCVQKIKPEI